MKTTAIVIPARYASTRFPGKPLALIGGRSMLARTVDVARTAAEGMEHVSVLVTTEDERIAEHCADIGVRCILTSAECATGSDRALAAVRQLGTPADFILNLQGDAPFTPPPVVRAMIEAFYCLRDLEVITPVHRLSWGDLDRLRESKKETPFSGTTVILDAEGRAVWFSKNIIPAIRKEDRSQPFSPVYQHMGLYGFSLKALETFCALPQSHYEELEGLEQLRMIENGLTVQTIDIEIDKGLIQTGIDTPADLARAEAALKGAA